MGYLFRSFLAIVVISAFIMPQLTVAQDADDEEDQVFVLSPFEVNTSGDMGYTSENTLAGTRLNAITGDRHFYYTEG